MEKHKKIDTKAIEYHIAGILKALGDNPEREGLIDTPKRVAKMYEEVFEGMNYTNEEIVSIYFLMLFHVRLLFYLVTILFYVTESAY